MSSSLVISPRSYTKWRPKSGNRIDVNRPGYMVPSMRVLFSSTRGAGHLQPLLPYARALVARRHEVAVAAPEEVGKTLRDAGLPHLPFDHPGDDLLAPIWARLR